VNPTGQPMSVEVAMVPFAQLLKALDDINDPRRPQGQRYRLSHLLLYCVLGILSGANSYRSIRTFIRERNEILHELYGVGFRQVPAVNTIRNVIHSLTASHLEETFRRHAQAMLPPPSATDSSEAKRKPAIALDGKTLRHSFDHLNDQKATQVLTAFASEYAIILANVEVCDKTNEIPVAQELIVKLGLRGVIFTADAMHCQKNISGFGGH
jgi:DDE_Tnp_1-associated